MKLSETMPCGLEELGIVSLLNLFINSSHHQSEEFVASIDQSSQCCHDWSTFLDSGWMVHEWWNWERRIHGIPIFFSPYKSSSAVSVELTGWLSSSDDASWVIIGVRMMVHGCQNEIRWLWNSERDSESRLPRIPSVCCCTGVKVHAGYRQKWTVRMDICGRTDECQKSLTWSMVWIYEGTEFFFLCLLNF